MPTKFPMIKLIASPVDARNLSLHHPLIGDINLMAYFLMLGPQYVSD